MKKFLSMSALALSVAALSTPEAPAWINAKFGAGVNIGWQSAGNNFGWGFFRNGQPPTADACPGVPQYPQYPQTPAPSPGPHGLQQMPASVDNGITAGVEIAPPANQTPTIPGQGTSYQRTWAQTVNYQYPYSYPYYYNYGYNYNYSYPGYYR